MTDRATLEAAMRGPIQRTNKLIDEPCPLCGKPLAINGTGSEWCIRISSIEYSISDPEIVD